MECKEGNENLNDFVTSYFIINKIVILIEIELYLCVY